MFYYVPEWLRRFFLRPMLVSVVLTIVATTGCVKRSTGVEKPTSSLASVVAKEARPQLKAIYAQAAKAVAYDGTVSAPLLRSTIDAAEYIGRLNRYRMAGATAIASDAFSAELDRRWLDQIGKPDVPLTPELRAKVVALLQGVADEL